MYSNFIKEIIVLWNKTIFDVFHALHMALLYRSKINFNRGQGRILYSLVARQRGLL